ncbi:MAG: diguanylate cyclase [Ruminococcus sp.]|nr:diguanylate cyclase [Ruminococcus sp.]
MEYNERTVGGVNGQNLFKRMLSMRNILVFMYTILGIVVFGLVAMFFLRANNSALNNQSLSYTTGAARQSVRNIENYCDGFEGAASVLYSEPGAEAFYPKNSEPTPAELDMLARITDSLSLTAYLLEYSDCGVLYSNGMTAGLVSDGLRDSLGTEGFQNGIDLLDGRDSTWVVFPDSTLPRACYIKKINDNALFISGFYTTSLGSVFEKMNGAAELAVYVTDSKGRVIFSPEFGEAEVGGPIPSSVTEGLRDSGSAVCSSKRSACMMTADNGWNVYAVILHGDAADAGRMRTVNFALITFVSMLFVFIVGGIIVSSVYLYSGHSPALARNATDQLTGLMSGYYCEERISDVMETTLVGSTWAYALVKIKDYELIRSRLGDEFADTVMKNIAELIKGYFDNDTVAGLNDKAEFMIFADYSDYDIFKAHDELKSQLTKLCEQLSELTVGGEEGTRLGIGMGVCIYPDDGSTFDELDFAASEALALSLAEEKSVCVFYKPADGTEGKH